MCWELCFLLWLAVDPCLFKKQKIMGIIRLFPTPAESDSFTVFLLTLDIVWVNSNPHPGTQRSVGMAQFSGAEESVLYLYPHFHSYMAPLSCPSCQPVSANLRRIGILGLLEGAWNVDVQSQNSLGISVLWKLRAEPLVSNWWVKEYKHPSIFALIRSTPRCDLSCLRSCPVELSKGYFPWTWPDLVTLASLSSLHSPATLLPILIKHYNRNLCLQVSWRPQSRHLVFIFLAASSLYTHIWAHLPTSAQTHSTQSPLSSAHATLLLTC